jgi:hypothetical protein
MTAARRSGHAMKETELLAILGVRGHLFTRPVHAGRAWAAKPLGQKMEPAASWSRGPYVGVWPRRSR